MKVQIFDQNHGLTPLQKQIFDFLQNYKFFDFLPFYSLERLVLSLKHYLEVFQGVFSIKKEMHESLNF